MTTQTLSLDKDGHTYVFRYSPGRENEVMDEIIRLAEDPQSTLDWLDAATLSFQVAQSASSHSPQASRSASESPK